jgi:hypothetical protein
MAMPRVMAADVIHPVVVSAAKAKAFMPAELMSGRVQLECDEAEIEADGHRPGFPVGEPVTSSRQARLKSAFVSSPMLATSAVARADRPPIAALPAAGPDGRLGPNRCYVRRSKMPRCSIAPLARPIGVNGTVTPTVGGPGRIWVQCEAPGRPSYAAALPRPSSSTKRACGMK